jgi:hypothetical protein
MRLVEDPMYPREPSFAEYNDPVLRRNRWLEDHAPGGTIGYPWPGEPQMRAAVGGTVITFTARDDLGELMDAVDVAEAEGKCPLHPAGSSSGADQVSRKAAMS